MFRRLGIGTRYDRLATRFLADLGIAAAVSYWLGVLTLESNALVPAPNGAMISHR